MKRAPLLALFALAGCAPSGPHPAYQQLLTPQANPAKVVASELAFARAARDKGQWTAFAEYSTPDAVMFVPEVVNAHQWLKGRANPPAAVKWQPHEVWSSCDGSLAVTKGAWQRADGSVGYFTTVWQKQKDGEYKWVMDQGDSLKEPLAEPEFVRTEVAQCGASRPFPLITALAPGYTSEGNGSIDGTLEWRVAISPDASERIITVYMLRDGQMAPVLNLTVRAAQ